VDASGRRDLQQDKLDDIKKAKAARRTVRNAGKQLCKRVYRECREILQKDKLGKLKEKPLGVPWMLKDGKIYQHIEEREQIKWTEHSLYRRVQRE
jgi:predicted thioredoxin/glutaredoxin